MGDVGKESSYSGALVSLSGIVDNSGRGRVSDAYRTLATVGGTIALPTNLKRIFAMLINRDSSAVMVVLSSEGYQYGFYLPPGGNIQIDKDLPWTGPVKVVGTATIDWVEISLP